MQGKKPVKSTLQPSEQLLLGKRYRQENESVVTLPIFFIVNNKNRRELLTDKHKRNIKYILTCAHMNI